ncbi:MAG: glutathione peroxidase [Arenimonas sp.]
MGSFYDYRANLTDGQSVSMACYKGNVVLVVNVASKCKLAPQYSALATLYNAFSDRGFSVLGFPCNQFANQEPLHNSEIKLYCSEHYGVRFPMFEKILVNGPNAHPLYQFLKKERRGFLFSESIKWNFTKFLIDQQGAVVARYSPTTRPEKIVNDIQNLFH